MHALKAARRVSCGFGAVLVPASSSGSSTRIVKSFGTRFPLISQPVTSVSETVPPAQRVMTPQRVSAFEGSFLTVSISVCSAGTFTPLRWSVLGFVAIMVLSCPIGTVCDAFRVGWPARSQYVGLDDTRAQGKNSGLEANLRVYLK